MGHTSKLTFFVFLFCSQLVRSAQFRIQFSFGENANDIRRFRLSIPDYIAGNPELLLQQMESELGLNTQTLNINSTWFSSDQNLLAQMPGQVQRELAVRYHHIHHMIERFHQTQNLEENNPAKMTKRQLQTMVLSVLNSELPFYPRLPENIRRPQFRPDMMTPEMTRVELARLNREFIQKIATERDEINHLLLTANEYQTQRDKNIDQYNRCINKGIDLAYQFGSSFRDSQSDIGSCTFFSSLGLVESAIYRRYGIRMDLSEADLFVQQKMDNPNFYRPVIASFLDGDGLCAPDEAHYIDENLSYIQNHGVLPENYLTYLNFKNKYQIFRNNLYIDAQEKFITCGRSSGVLNMFTSNFVFASDFSFRYAKYYGPQFRDRLFRQADQTLDEQNEARELIKKSLDQLDYIHYSVNNISKGYYRDKKSCKEHGAFLKNQFIQLLCHQTPIAVGAYLGGIRGQPIDTPLNQTHAFIITGFHFSPNGEVEFTTKDSLDPYRPVNLKEEDLCRIMDMLYYPSVSPLNEPSMARALKKI